MNRTMTMLSVALLAGLTALPTGQSINVDALVDKSCDAADRLLAGNACGGDLYEPCPSGQSGVDLGTVSVCRTPPGPIEPCPEGQIGVSTGGAKGCHDVPQPPLPCLKCEPGGDQAYPKPKGGSCSGSDDGSGWGNPHASCPLPCAYGSILGIGVASADPTAMVYGDVNCGGTGAPCGPTMNVCFGVSGEPASRSDDAGECHGHADEWFDNAITLACVATFGADFGDNDPAQSAKKIVCAVYPNFPTCDSFAAMAVNCIAAHPELLRHGESVVLGLFPAELADLPVSSYVGGLFLPDGSVTTVSYRIGDAVCSVA